MFQMTLPILVQLPQASVSGECWTLHITQRAEKSLEQRIQDQESARRGDEPEHVIRHVCELGNHHAKS